MWSTNSFNFNQLKSVQYNVSKNVFLTFFIGTYLGIVWMYEYRFLMMPKYNQIRLLQETFKVKQTEIASRLNQDQENKDQEES